MSDELLPLVVLDFRDLTSVEGRTSMHGEEESSGRSWKQHGTAAACERIRSSGFAS
jgi:hypothetical protein